MLGILVPEMRMPDRLDGSWSDYAVLVLVLFGRLIKERILMRLFC